MTQMTIKLKRKQKLSDNKSKEHIKEVQVIKEYENFYLVQHPERIQGMYK